MKDMDPHLEDVLRELASGPRAAVSQVDPRRAVAALRGQSIVSGASRLRTGAAKRELLSVHRAELAFALRRSTVLALAYAKDRDPRLFIDFALPNTEARRPRSVGTKASDLLECARLDVTEGEELTNQAAIDLAVLALEYEEHISPRTCIAAVLIARGRLHAAEAGLRRLLRAPLRRSDRRFAFELLGEIEAERGHFGPAAELYLRAAADAPSAGYPWACAALNAMLVGDTDIVKRVDVVLSDLPAVEEAALEQARATFRSWYRSLSAEVEVHSAARRLEEHLSARTRTLLDAFF